MKKLFSLLCAVLLFIISTSALSGKIVYVVAGDINKNDFAYSIEDGNAILFDYYGTKTHLVIPEEFDGYPLTEIRAFSGYCETEISDREYTIPSSSVKVTIDRVSRLQSITIPKTVTKITNGVFAHINSLNALTVDAENPTYYSKGNCVVERATETVISGSRSAHVPETAKSIGESAFEASPIKTITIPEGITEIGFFAFYDCTDLHTVKLPDTLTHIKEYAFRGCTSLAQLTVPASVETIDHGAFEGCSALYSVTVAEENPTFYAEGRCILTCADKRIVAAGYNAKLPEGVTKVEAHALENCLNEYIEELILPETLTSIGEYAFAGNGFEKVVIPASLTEIGANAFTHCYSLRTIEVAEDNPRYYSEGGCLIDREANAVVSSCVSKATVPHGITAIGDAAFQNYSGATVSLPATVLNIAEGAFRSMNALEVDYDGSPVMWSVLPTYETGLQNVKADCKGKDADTLAVADFDGDGIIRLRDVLRAASATDGEDIDGDSIFTEADIRWIAMLCTAE